MGLALTMVLTGDATLRGIYPHPNKALKGDLEDASYTVARIALFFFLKA